MAAKKQNQAHNGMALYHGNADGIKYGNELLWCTRARRAFIYERYCICLAAIILDPVAAFMVGGVGAFLGDLFFYPAPMLVSLVTHGLQAVVISIFSHYIMKKQNGKSVQIVLTEMA